MSGFFSSFVKTSKDKDILRYKERVVLVESHFRQLAKLVEKYAKTTEKLGDRGASISDAILSSFKEKDDVKSGLEKFCNSLEALNDERKKLANDLKSGIAGDFRINMTKCKETKKEIDVCIRLIDKEYHEKEQLLKQQSKVPVDRRKVMETKVRLEKAQTQTKNSRNWLDEQMEEFEIQKRNDSGRILREFVRKEMKFHAKCLETYTSAYKHLMNIPDTANVSTVYRLCNEETKIEPTIHVTPKDVLFVKSNKHDSRLSLRDLE